MAIGTMKLSSNEPILSPNQSRHAVIGEPRGAEARSHEYRRQIGAVHDGDQQKLSAATARKMNGADA